MVPAPYNLLYPHNNRHRPIIQPTAAPTDRILKIPSVKLSQLVIGTHSQRDFLSSLLAGAAEGVKFCRLGRRTARLALGKYVLLNY